MIDDSKILIIGGSGLLGTELRKLYPNAYAPSHKELDINSSPILYSSTADFKRTSYNLIINCAVSKKDNLDMMRTNINGTTNLVNLCNWLKAKLIYISTDYVFDGTNYLSKPLDRTKPYNYYGETKLAGEYCVKALPENQYLILRGSFSPEQWPFDNAYTNHYTTKLPVSLFASKIRIAIGEGLSGIHHIAGKRQSIWEYATKDCINPNRTILQKRDKSIKHEPYELDFSLSNTVF